MPPAAAGAAQSALCDDAQSVHVDEIVPLQRVGVAVLGARGVGKTSLVCQFVYHDLRPPDDDDQHRSSRSNTLGEVTSHICGRKAIAIL